MADWRRLVPSTIRTGSPVADLRYAPRDLWNLIHFGAAAPRSAQLLFMRPEHITHCLPRGVFGRKDTGRVVGGDWDLTRLPLKEGRKYQICRARLVDGLDWELAGAFEHMDELLAERGEFDGCATREDVERRYAAVDRLAADWVAGGAFATRRELHRLNFREWGGVYVHFGRDGEPLFGRGGWHRLALAQILAFEVIPVEVGVVHVEAVRGGHFQRHVRASRRLRSRPRRRRR